MRQLCLPIALIVALVRHGTISARDLDLVHRTDSVDDACDWVIQQLAKHALGQPGPTL